MNYDYVKENLEQIKLRISQAAEKANRKAEEIKLVAVSKNFPVEAVKAAFEAGQRIFGENRVQELAAKAPLLPSEIEWHLIGHLQSNKVSKALQFCELIHSVDSVDLIKRISRLAHEKNKTQKILLEVNISGEESKFGIRGEDELFKCIEESLQADNVLLQGLMTMAPFEAEPCEIRKVFSSLRVLKEKSEEKFGIKLPELSMGMSGDFEIAIEEGTTLVRIGTAIFGKR